MLSSLTFCSVVALLGRPVRTLLLKLPISQSNPECQEVSSLSCYLTMLLKSVCVEEAYLQNARVTSLLPLDRLPADLVTVVDTSHEFLTVD